MRTCLLLLTVVALLSAARAEACVTPGLPGPELCAWLRSEGALVLVRVERVSGEPVDLGRGEEEEEEIFQRTLHVRVLQWLKGSAPERFRINAGWRSRAALAREEVSDTPLLVQILLPAEPEEGPEPQLPVDPLFFDDPEKLRLYVDRLAEAAQLLQRQASPAEEREWLVRCAVRRATRAGALTALLAMDAQEGREDGRPPGPLTLEQRRAILDGFRQEPSTDDTFLEVLQLGRGVSHPAFDRVAVGVMETLLFGTDGDLAPEAPQALSLLMERLGVPDVDARWSAVQAALDARAKAAVASTPSSDTTDSNAYLVDGLGNEVRDPATVAADAAVKQALCALWDALRSAGHLVPAPRVPHA